MQLLADAGVPAATILRAATANAAEALGAADRLGRIAAGYEADIMLLRGNPLTAIEHSLDIVQRRQRRPAHYRSRNRQAQGVR